MFPVAGYDTAMRILLATLEFTEIIVVAIVALVAYGKDLPNVARKVGTTYVQFRRKLQGLQHDVMQDMQGADVRKEVRQIVNDVKREVEKDVEQPIQQEVNGVAEELRSPLPAPLPEPTTEEAYRAAESEKKPDPPITPPSVG